jgi:hypothetical protein
MAAVQVVGFTTEQASVVSVRGDDEAIEISDVLEESDAIDLKWYFRVGGLAIFSSSTMGPMLERAELLGSHARGCRSCGGDPVRCIGGTGWTVGRKPRKTTVTGAEVALARWAKTLYRQRLFADEPCRKCGGTGWRPAGRRVVPRDLQTARLMGSSVKRAGGPSATVRHLEVLAIVGRRLDQIGPHHAATFLAYFDEDGGSVLAVWALTAAGRTLLRRNSHDLDPVRFFENERLDQEQHRDAGRQALFDTADEQAADRISRASHAWNSLKLGEERARCRAAT